MTTLSNIQICMHVSRSTIKIIQLDHIWCCLTYHVRDVSIKSELFAHFVIGLICIDGGNIFYLTINNI